jgi:hypothetical protein
MTVDLLRSSLAKLEDAKRFMGRPYPQGIEPFPRTLVGQGFFPGGDGLWRESTPTALRRPSPYAFPKNGIMFLGNDFGTVSAFQRLGVHENPPTWLRLRRRLQVAKIPGMIGFYTNAYLGLRGDRLALAHPISDPTFNDLCAEFLDIQITHQSPRLVVVLGPRPANLLNKVLNLPHRAIGTRQKCNYGGRAVSVVIVSHPYSDLGKEPLLPLAEGEVLARAWAVAIGR